MLPESRHTSERMSEHCVVDSDSDRVELAVVDWSLFIRQTTAPTAAAEAGMELTVSRRGRIRWLVFTRAAADLQRMRYALPRYLMLLSLLCPYCKFSTTGSCATLPISPTVTCTYLTTVLYLATRPT